MNTVFDIHQRHDYALIFLDGEEGRITIKQPGQCPLTPGASYMGKPKKNKSPFTQPKVKSAIPKLPKAPAAPLKLPKPVALPTPPPSNLVGSGSLAPPSGGPKTPPLITGTSNIMLPKPKRG